jgi:hypothetical protein
VPADIVDDRSSLTVERIEKEANVEVPPRAPDWSREPPGVPGCPLNDNGPFEYKSPVDDSAKGRCNPDFGPCPGLGETK